MCVDSQTKDGGDIVLEKLIINTEKFILHGNIVLKRITSTDLDGESLLLYWLNNSEIKFIKIENCIISDKFDKEFRPVCIDNYFLNVDIIQSCYISND